MSPACDTDLNLGYFLTGSWLIQPWGFHFIVICPWESCINSDAQFS